MIFSIRLLFFSAIAGHIPEESHRLKIHKAKHTRILVG